MNGKHYIKAKLMSDFGILNIDGTECVKMGEYEDIVSAGDIGWLAKQYDKQYLLNEAGEVTKELKGIYDGCIGNRYLMGSYDMKANDSVVKSTMKDGSGDESCKIFESYGFGDVYDLDENLLISLESKKIFSLNWLIDGDKFAVYIREDEIDDDYSKKLKLIDNSGNIIPGLEEDANVNIVGVAKEQNKVILNKGWGNIYEYDLNSGIEASTEFTEYTGKDEGWLSGIKIEKTGDFYQCNKNGEPLFDERFADYHFRHGVLYLENTDSLWGIVDYDGNTVMPFELSDDTGFYTEILESDGMFGFYTESNGNYEFHNFLVAKGRTKN